MSPHERVQAILMAQTRAERAAVARTHCTAGVVLRSGFGDQVGDEFFDDIVEPFTDVRILDAFAESSSGAVVFSARDPITNLWHRCAWVFHHQSGHITEVFANSQIVPPPPDAT